MQDRLTVYEVANEADCTHWTVRNYLRRGVIEGLKDSGGKWWLHPDTPQQIREHMAAHGGPGGRSLVLPS